jgi:hypothetical protein
MEASHPRQNFKNKIDMGNAGHCQSDSSAAISAIQYSKFAEPLLLSLFGSSTSSSVEQLAASALVA